LHLLVFNLGMDAAHSTLGHTTAWTNELARRADRVSVITMFAGDVDVEPNVSVHSLGKELGRSEPRRLLEFYRLAGRTLDGGPIDACFAHMAPLFAALYAPVARRHRTPILLWYAHPSITRTLRIAHALVDRCVTASPGSFPLESNKLFVVGHGIDTDMFRPPTETAPTYGATAISIGRITPIKRIEEMLEAIAILNHRCGLGLRLSLVGGAATAADHRYAAALRRTVATLRIDEFVTFDGPVPYHDVPSRYHAGGLFLNLSGGAMDKAILESMASGCIPISRNPAFQALARAHGLEWLVPGSGAEGLAHCIQAALEQPPRERAAIAARLRRIVTDEHSLATLSDRIIAHLHELARTDHRP
jgi:glycosyltransferase involved in cell wall biosynthesis